MPTRIEFPATGTGRVYAPAWVLAFLAAVLATVLGLFTAGPASAAPGSAAQNTVGASASAAQVTVEPSASITPGQRLGTDPPQPRIVVATGVAANTAVRPAQVAFGPVPENAWATLGRVQSKGSPLPGYKGGSTFGDTGQAGGQVLPRSTSGGSPITYREWDVNPYVKGVDRGGERIVTGSDGSAYYTSDHYRSFTQFWSGG